MTRPGRRPFPPYPDDEYPFMEHGHSSRQFESRLPKLGLGWRLWFVAVATLGLGTFGLMVWAIIAAIQWLGRH